MAQTLLIFLREQKIGDAFHPYRVRRFFRIQRSTFVKLFHALHQAVILTAFLLDATREFSLQSLDRPATKVLIQETRRHLQVLLGKLALHAEDAIANDPTGCYHHRQDLLPGETREMNVVERVLLARGGNGHAYSARYQ